MALPYLRIFESKLKAGEFPFLSYQPEQAEQALKVIQFDGVQIRKEDFIYLGQQNNHPFGYFFLWEYRIRHEHYPEEQPIVFVSGTQRYPVGVIADNLREFLSILPFGEAIYNGLSAYYEPSPKTSSASEADQQALSSFSAYLKRAGVSPAEDVAGLIAAAASKFPALDRPDYLWQLSKSYPKLQMPALIEQFHQLLHPKGEGLGNLQPLPERFNYDAFCQLLSPQLAPHFSPIAQTNQGGYLAIWRVFPDLPSQENPVVLIAGKDKTIGVLSRNFQEFLQISYSSFERILADVVQNEGEWREPYQIPRWQQLQAELFAAQNGAAGQDYLHFVTQQRGAAQQSSLQIIERAYYTLPNLSAWLHQQQPERWALG